MHTTKTEGRDEVAKLSHVGRGELGEGPVSVIAVRGKELQLECTVGEARRLFARRAVKVVPVLSGRRYVGVVDRDALAGVPDALLVGALVRSSVAVAHATTSIHDALGALDADGGSRLIVVDKRDGTYVGVVCLRGDREGLCVDRARLAAGQSGSRR